MANTGSWDETDPANNKNPKLGAQDIRYTKRDVRERLENGAHYMAGSGNDSDDGKHVCGIGDSEATGDFTVYEADKSTAALTVSDSTGTNADTVQLGDGAGGSNNYTLDTEVVNAQEVVVGDTLDVTGAVTLSDVLQLDDKLVVTRTAITQASSPYTAADSTVIMAVLTSDAIVNLPAAADVVNRVYVISNSAESTLGASVTVTPDGSETIAGAVSLVLDKGECAVIQCDISNWQVLSIYRRYAMQVAQEISSTTGTLTDTYGTYATEAVYIPASGVNNRVLLSFSGTMIMNFVFAGSDPSVDLRFLRDAAPLSGAEFTEISSYTSGTTKTARNRVHAEFLDTSPTLGDSHTYTVQLRTSSALTSSTVDIDTDAPTTLTVMVIASNP